MVLVLRKTYFLKVVAKFDKDHFSFYDFFLSEPPLCSLYCFLNNRLPVSTILKNIVRTHKIKYPLAPCSTAPEGCRIPKYLNQVCIKPTKLGPINT